MKWDGGSKQNTCMHFDISCNCIKVNSRYQFTPPNVSHHEHILAHVPWSPNKYLKYSFVWTKCWCQFVWKFDCYKILMSWNDLKYPRSKYMNNPQWFITTMLFMQYIFFHPLNQLQWAELFQGLWILMILPSINPMQPWNYGSCITKTRHSSIVGHQISSIMVELMQDVIKMSSSFIALLFQFHRNTSYLVTLSCFIYNMKLSKRYCGVNLDGR